MSFLSPHPVKKIKMEINCGETVDGQLLKTSFDTDNQSDNIPEFKKVGKQKQKALISPELQDLQEIDYLDDDDCDRLDVCEAAVGEQMWFKENMTGTIEPLQPAKLFESPAAFFNQSDVLKKSDLNLSTKDTHKNL